MSSPAGTLYLLHFEREYGRGRHGRARHYLGWTVDVERRLAEHLAGKGSPLVAAVVAAGIGVELVATWPGTRQDERARKAGHRLSRYCPHCAPATRADDRRRARGRRRP